MRREKMRGGTVHCKKIVQTTNALAMQRLALSLELTCVLPLIAAPEFSSSLTEDERTEIRQKLSLDNTKIRTSLEQPESNTRKILEIRPK